MIVIPLRRERRIMSGKLVKKQKMTQEEIDELLRTGEVGATPITQFIDGKMVSYWLPSLNGIFVSSGPLEKFASHEEATERAIEIKKQAAAKRQAV